MRRLLRTLASGQEISGDTSTLEDSIWFWTNCAKVPNLIAGFS
jgi:hypothetical protein